MLEFKQLYSHNPPHTYGDCFRTVLGCLLDMPPEKVPHFYDGIDKNDDATDANKAIRYWLQQQGYVIFTVAYECEVDVILHSMSINNPTAFYIITGKSVTGNNHCCVGLGGKIVWDPAPENQGLIGPNSNGQVIIEVLIPIGQSSGWLSTGDTSHSIASKSGGDSIPVQA